MRNLFSVEGKNVLVTGGSRGIGEMIARGYVGGTATTDAGGATGQTGSSPDRRPQGPVPAAATVEVTSESIMATQVYRMPANQQATSAA